MSLAGQLAEASIPGAAGTGNQGETAVVSGWGEVHTCNANGEHICTLTATIFNTRKMLESTLIKLRHPTLA